MFNKKNIKVKFTIAFIMIFLSVSLNAKNAISFNNDGWRFLNIGDSQNAVFSFKSALKLNPSYYDSIVGLGESYYRMEVYESAYDLYKKAIAINSESNRGLMGMAFTLTAMGRYKEALTYFGKAEGSAGENLDASYGIAYLYNSIGKKIIAKRKLISVLKIDPYHYNSLLLLAELENGDNRIEKAKKIIEKAINSNNEASGGYLRLGEIYISDYLKNHNEKSLTEAIYLVKNALSINPKSFNANRLMGNIHFMNKEYDKSIIFFKNALKQKKNSLILYSLGVAYDKKNDKRNALSFFLKSYKMQPLDSILRSRLEDFLYLRNYKIGHPVRIMLSRESYRLAIKKEKENMPDAAIGYLRRTIYLNNQNKDARLHLNSYYSTLDYNRFYIDGIKTRMRNKPSRKLRTKLNLEIIKRRKYLYHREGFSSEVPKRDVPNVLVLDFTSTQRISPHIDASSVIGNSLTFYIKQFGRMNVVGVRSRELIVKNFKKGNEFLESVLKSVKMKIDLGEIQSVDYIVFGDYREMEQRISIDCKVLDYKTGIIVGSFSLFESGREALARLSLRAARRVYDIVPFKGRVLKKKERSVVVNLGSFDGVKAGDMLYVDKFRRNSSFKSGKSLKMKIFFKVKEVNTLVLLAEPVNQKHLKEIDYNDKIYPLKKRKARLVR